MASKRHAPKGKFINPHFWVFCEGETEEEYIRFLRSEYRLPVEIISKIAGCDINSRYIASFKKGKPQHEKDKNFLIYDADVPHILDSLKQIPNVILIASNPSIELWFLLHYKNQTVPISQNECIQQLNKRNRNIYKKGFLDEVLKKHLIHKRKEACKRARQLNLFDNPSTNMYDFIENLEEARFMGGIPTRQT